MQDTGASLSGGASLPRVLVLLIGEVLDDPRVLRTCRSLAGRGAEVVVGCTNVRGLPDREEREGLLIHRVRHRGESIVKRVYQAVQNRLKPEDRSRIAGLHEQPPASAAGKFIRDALLGVNFRQYQRESDRIAGLLADQFADGRFDLVHCNDIDTLPAGCRLKTTGVARALLYDSHEFWPGIGVHASPQNTAYQAIEERLIGMADQVVTVSDPIADEMQRLYRLRVRPSVVMNCPDLAPSPLSYEVNRPVRVLYQGKVQAFRGIEPLVRAFAVVPDMSLTIAGYGPLETPLRRLAESLGLADRVYFTGRYAPDSAIDIARAHDIAVLPFEPVTESIRFSAPNKLFDALMAGLAVAVAGLPVIEDITRSHDLGMVFPAIDPDAIAMTLRDMAADPEQLTKWKRNARHAAETSYHWEVQFDRNYPWRR